MDIYFGASVRGGRQMEHLYPMIVNQLQDMGHHVISAMFAEQGISDEKGTNPEMTDEEIFERDVRWINEAEAMVAEITNPSIGVGREIQLALDRDIPVVALFNTEIGKKATTMVAGDKTITFINYGSVVDLREGLEEALYT